MKWPSLRLRTMMLAVVGVAVLLAIQSQATRQENHGPWTTLRYRHEDVEVRVLNWNMNIKVFPMVWKSEPASLNLTLVGRNEFSMYGRRLEYRGQDYGDCKAGDLVVLDSGAVHVNGRPRRPTQPDVE